MKIEPGGENLPAAAVEHPDHEKMIEPVGQFALGHFTQRPDGFERGEIADCDAARGELDVEAVAQASKDTVCVNGGNTRRVASSFWDSGRS